jgi:hypothetical protein
MQTPSSSKKHKDGKKLKSDPGSSSKKASHSKKGKKVREPESSGSESSGDSSEESEEEGNSSQPESSKGAKVRTGGYKPVPDRVKQVSVFRETTPMCSNMLFYTYVSCDALNPMNTLFAGQALIQCYLSWD